MGMGGGMPVGAFTASSEMMDLLSDNPKGAHHNFGGHPVIAAACLATLKLLKPISCRKQLKGNPFKSLLVHPLIEEVRGGLMLACVHDITNEVILKCKTAVLYYFGFFLICAMNYTPLTISERRNKKDAPL
jgi:4-aminobutyrate aminotransferase-like enzyme